MRHLPGQAQQLPGNRSALRKYRARHFLFAVKERVATLTLNRPDHLRWCRRGAGPGGRFSLWHRAHGPSFAHGMTKKMLQQKWNMGVDETIEAKAQAQAICMATNDFRRAYHAFVAKQNPVFEGD